jgi:hypothetical protein
MPRHRLPLPLADLEESQSAASRVMRHMLAVSDPQPPARLAPVVPMNPTIPRKKNPAAVALGRLGGRKGGKARAAALTPEQRKAIGQQGAAARWGKKNS